MSGPPLCQIAFSVTDLRRTQAWYRDALGFEPAGGTNLFAGPLSSMVQGLPRAASTCWWLVDRQDLFQLELFEFRSPPVRPLPADWRPCDVGYSMVGIHVADLDATIERLGSAGSAPLADPVGPIGSRRVCVRDPEGVLLELMEDDPRENGARERSRPDLPIAARSVTLSVPDLDRSRGFFGDVLGLEAADGVTLHGPEHEALWGLEGAKRHTQLMWAGDFLVELVAYDEPRGKPWPNGYRISDQGLLNVAFGFRDRGAFEAMVRRCREAGYEGNAAPMRLGSWSVIYVNDDQGFSVELLHIERWYEGQMGFKPRRTPRIAPFVGRRRTPGPAFRRAVITGAAGGLGGELATMLATDGTDLIPVDRDAGGLERLAEELGSTVDVKPVELDMADLEAVDDAARGIVEANPEIDLVIAAAGLDRAQSLLAFDWRQARDDFSVNALANLVLFSHLLPAMAERGGGHVTAIASLAAKLGMPFEASYSGSKAALAAITESARAELGPKGLTFTTVFPGFVDTPMFRANAFKHTYSIPARDAAELIYSATVSRRAELHFPAREHARIRLGRLLPAKLRDRIAREAMNEGAIRREPE
jgi:short-subunit dehydrogenase/catechol 2,3-dioxygenase-like lactoylglutathione lyase family enzyme